jgi:hypothetical protein
VIPLKTLRSRIDWLNIHKAKVIRIPQRLLRHRLRRLARLVCYEQALKRRIEVERAMIGSYYRSRKAS